MADKVTKDVKDEKSKNLEQALLQIEKAYGKGAIMKLGEDASNQNVDVISTGCLTLDLALGVGGIPGIDSQAQKQEQGQEYQVFDEIPEKTHS